MILVGLNWIAAQTLGWFGLKLALGSSVAFGAYNKSTPNFFFPHPCNNITCNKNNTGTNDKNNFIL